LFDSWFLTVEESPPPKAYQPLADDHPTGSKKPMKERYGAMGSGDG
jgi:hypothetical protein